MMFYITRSFAPKWVTRFDDMILSLRTVFACLCALGSLSAGRAAPAAPAIPLEIPQPVDPRLELTLYADAPEIVTPIGAAIDARGRLFVLESHTHLASRDYKGPKRDRVKIFEGARTDGRAAHMRVYADQILEGMNLAFAPDGTLYVCTAQSVEALPDRDGDGRSEESIVILRLDTEQKYPHSQLLGLTFSHDGWLYVSRGNTGGKAHAWVGTDGRRLEAVGNGGDIVRCRPDGSQLERVATGFWNPFDLKFDRRGRLLCADNDPDSRGPNRLVHIVIGGDYGYKTRYGASGLHPYQSWDGELPGTLPMVAGLGEAPSGVIDLSYSALPDDYRDAIAATIWGENEIVLVRPRAAGVSLRGTAEPFIRGGRNFRPVAIVSAPDGSIYITDWVLKDYPNHGHGRIWKLKTRAGIGRMKPPAAFVPPEPDAGIARIEQLLGAGSAEGGAERPIRESERRSRRPGSGWPELRAALKDNDPFVRHAATVALARPEHRAAVTQLLESDAPALRLGALLALRRADVAEAEKLLRPRLRDRDEEVRRMAMVWAGEKELRSLTPAVEAAVDLPDLTPQLFEVWIATLQILQNEPLPPGAKPPAGSKADREPDVGGLERILADSRRAPALRIYALRRLAALDPTRHRPVLLELARAGDAELRVEALRTLAIGNPDGAGQELMRAIAMDRDEPPRVRADAIVALGAGATAALTPLLDDPEPAVRTQAARTLRVEAASSTKRVPAPAPDAVEEWVRLLATGGDVEAGERVFFSPMSMCAQCHTVKSRGGTLGPDLSLIARTVSRERMIRSIIAPSEEISPQFQGWEIRTTSGDVLTGLQGHWRGKAASLVMLDGSERRVPDGEVVSLEAMQRSLMPEGLAALFSVEELRDLVAYLDSLK